MSVLYSVFGSTRSEAQDTLNALEVRARARKHARVRAEGDLCLLCVGRKSPPPLRMHVQLGALGRHKIRATRCDLRVTV